MNNKTYNLDFTIRHNDNLVFEVDAPDRETALQNGIETIHNTMDGFEANYEIELNSCTEQPTTYTPLNNSSQGYTSLAQFYANSFVEEILTPEPPSLPTIPGYSRLVK